MTDFNQLPSGAPEGVPHGAEIPVGPTEASRPIGKRVVAVVGAIGVVGGGTALAANVVPNDGPQERAAGWQPIVQESFPYCDKDNAQWSITLTGLGEPGPANDYDVDVVLGSVSPSDARVEDGDYNYASVIGTWPLSVASGTVSARFVYDGAANHGPLDGSATHDRPDDCKPDDTIPEETTTSTTTTTTTTTLPPVETTEPPVETTEPPVETTEPPVETTEPPTTTSSTTTSTTTTVPVTTTSTPVVTSTTVPSVPTIPSGE